MANKKGFTILEIMIVVIIVGILAAIAIPNIMIYIEQTKAQTAQNNLLTIAAAESKYYEDNNSTYCTGTCGNSSNLYASLSLSMTPNDNFTYSCTDLVLPSGTLSYQCTASDTMGTTLTLNPNAQPPTGTCVGNSAGIISSCPVSCYNASNNSLCPTNLQ